MKRINYCEDIVNALLIQYSINNFLEYVKKEREDCIYYIISTDKSDVKQPGIVVIIYKNKVQYKIIQNVRSFKSEDEVLFNSILYLKKYLYSLIEYRINY